MPPGALEVARRHDPLTAAGAPERDAGSVNDSSQQPARPPVLRASLTSPAAPARQQPIKVNNALTSARSLDCLSQAVYYEARGESREGQEAVATVVMNRVHKPGFPKTVCGVVFQGAQGSGCQFSFACDGAAHRPKEMTAWRKAQGIAAKALGGFVLAQVGGATHFHVVGLNADWGGGFVRVAQIGAHSFYRLTAHGAPAVYAHASEVADKPAFTEAKASTLAAPEGSSLMMAAAVAPAPGAAQKPTAPAPAADKPVETAGKAAS
jgi:spore germination cell wall hydrolase CwlJ-like protein